MAVTLNTAVEANLAQPFTLGDPATGTEVGQITATCDPFDNALVDTPAIIETSIGNGIANETVTITRVGDATVLVTVDLDENGSATVDVPIPALAAGSYTLQYSGSAGDSTTLAFTVERGALSTTNEDSDALTVPSFTPTPTAVHHWQFIDNTIGDPHSYTMPKNPSKWTNPWKPQSLTHAATVAPDGQLLAWQAGDRAWTFQFSGVLTTQQEYEALQFWCDLRRRFWLIDHRDVARYVTFTHFDAQARIVPGNPWVHDYTVSVIHFLRPGSTSDE